MWSSSGPASPGWRRRPGWASVASLSTSSSARPTSAAGSAAGPTRCRRRRPSAMNRGFHAFFRQYYNLRTLLRRVDPHLSTLTAVDDYPLIDAAGRRDTFRGLPQHPTAERAGVRVAQPDVPAARPGPAQRPGGRTAGRGVGARHLRAARPRRRRQRSCGTSTFPKPHGIWRSRCSPAASSPSRPSCRRPSWPPCSTSTSSAPARAWSSTSPTPTSMWHCGIRCASTWSRHGVAVSHRRVGDRGARRRAADGALRYRGRNRLPMASCWRPTSRPCGSIVENSPGIGDDGWRRRVAALRNAAPFVVQRLWLDRPVSADRAAFLGTGGRPPLDNVSVLERYEREARKWSLRTGGSVVELHSYAVRTRTETDCASACAPDCTSCIPNRPTPTHHRGKGAVLQRLSAVRARRLRRRVRPWPLRTTVGAGRRRHPHRPAGGADGTRRNHRIRRPRTVCWRASGWPGMLCTPFRSRAGRRAATARRAVKGCCIDEQDDRT